MTVVNVLHINVTFLFTKKIEMINTFYKQEILHNNFSGISAILHDKDIKLITLLFLIIPAISIHST